ncbi:phosphatase PAP2 family protein [Ferruginibacter albus]|uniref:phosphatase PAP2 family protein n=1 Tax=Ferruginibacter albus TaxID=2875540 RepID=UPI001CC35608|nr:phosphatase PAP2 family protein [Ferruginibacter albus]UAY51249.1 phosphatase PAP2 family protein [Ferruginibacter albus]
MKYFLSFLLVFAFSKAKAQNFDYNLLNTVYKNETSFKNNFFKVDAQSVIVFNVAAPVSIFTVGLITHDKQLKRNSFFIAGAFVVSTFITQSTKQIVKRERPFIKYPQTFSDRYDGDGYSFPSGHVSSAFCTATSLSLYFPKWYVIGPSYLWAASIGWARMYQGVHYPSDVLAGAFVGAGSAWLGYKVQKYIDKKHYATIKNNAFAF